jgi:hypothetical protein
LSATPPPPAAAGRGIVAAGAALLALLAVFWSQFAWVRATNFGGMDEWLYISLSSRGVLGIPYANRPFVLMWTLPAAFLRPHDLRSFYFVHAAYLTLAGWLLFLLLRRLCPSRPLLAFLAGAFCLTWAPLDFLRLDTVLVTGYSGFTFATLLALVLFTESWARDKPVLLALAGLIALVAGRGFEGVLPLLIAAPLLLRWAEARRSRRLAVWILAWEALMLLIAALVLVPFLRPDGLGSYQASALKPDLHPAGVALRLLRQYGFHLLPLFTSPPRELIVPAVPVAVATFLAAFALVGRRADPLDVDSGERRALALLAALGAVLAALGYAPFVASASILTAARTQFLSAPGIGLLLAALALLAASALPGSWRKPALALMGAWVVAVGTGRTVAMQRDWDSSRSAYPRQRQALVELTRQVPDTRPNTLIVLIDDAGGWPATFTFRHAVDYLYEGRALGYVSKAIDFLYPAYFLPVGVYFDPWPVIRGSWGVAPTLHRYDEIVVAHVGPDGGLAVLPEWPGDLLPALPAGARYDPEARIVRGAPAPASRAILRIEPEPMVYHPPP